MTYPDLAWAGFHGVLIRHAYHGVQLVMTGGEIASLVELEVTTDVNFM